MKNIHLIWSLLLLPTLFFGCSSQTSQTLFLNLETALTHAANTTDTTSDITATEPATIKAVSMRPLTDGNCCTGHYWHSNTEIRFIDQNPETGEAGVWAIDLTAENSVPQFVTARLGVTSNDGRYFAYPDRETGLAIIEDTETERSWGLNLNESAVNFTPDSQRILWIEIDRDQPFETRTPVYWITDVGGYDARPIISLRRSSALDWLDNDTLLVSILADDENASQFAIRRTTIAKLSTIDGVITPYFETERPRGLVLNPSHTALVYITSLAQDPAENGIWHVDLTAETPTPERLPFLGTYRWLNDETLIYIPFEPDATRHHFFSYNIRTQQTTQITDDSLPPFMVTNNDWSVSPAGDKIIFLTVEGFSLQGLRLIELSR